MAFVSALFYTLRKKRTQFSLIPGASLLILFTGWTFLSTFQSPDSVDARASFFDLFFKSVALFFLSLVAIKSERSLRFVQGSLVCGGLGIAVVALVKTISIGGLADGRLSSYGLLSDPNDIAAVMMIIVPFSLFPAMRSGESKLTRGIALFAILCTIILLGYAKSRGALLSALVVFGVIVGLKAKKKTSVIAVALLALVLFIPITMTFHRSEDDLSDSSESRIVYWKAAVKMAAQNPIFGVGFGGYPLRFEQYTSKFIETGNRTAHSSWFLVLAEEGPLGFLLFICLYLTAVKDAWSIRLKKPEYLASALGYGTAMTFLSHSYSFFPYLLMALIFVAKRISGEEIATGKMR